MKKVIIILAIFLAWSSIQAVNQATIRKVQKTTRQIMDVAMKIDNIADDALDFADGKIRHGDREIEVNPAISDTLIQKYQVLKDSLKKLVNSLP